MVFASSGARTPGIDGMDKQRLQVKLDQHLDDLQASLLEDSYRPQPVKRIYIPKPNGKRRPLGIPTLTDRIVQRAMLMAMELTRRGAAGSSKAIWPATSTRSITGCF